MRREGLAFTFRKSNQRVRETPTIAIYTTEAELSPKIFGSGAMVSLTPRT